MAPSTEGTYNRTVPQYAAVMTTNEFHDACLSTAFIDYDGHGHPCKPAQGPWHWEMCEDTSICVLPSNHLDTIPNDATHVAWYNK